MRVQTVITLDRDELRKNIPYRVISETSQLTIWNTGKRKRRFKEHFTEDEQENCLRLVEQARAWTKAGAPEHANLTASDIVLWQRLANFCAEL